MAALTLRLDDNVHALLKGLAVVRHTSVNQLVTDAVAAEIEREFPGRLAKLRGTTPEQREAAFLAALGLTESPAPLPADQEDEPTRRGGRGERGAQVGVQVAGYVWRQLTAIVAARAIDADSGVNAE